MLGNLPGLETYLMWISGLDIIATAIDSGLALLGQYPARVGITMFAATEWRHLGYAVLAWSGLSGIPSGQGQGVCSSGLCY